MRQQWAPTPAGPAFALSHEQVHQREDTARADRCAPHSGCALGTQAIKLEAGQSIIVEAVGDRYTEFEGYKDEETGDTRIGLSYAKLCQSVKAGNRILLADGSISIRVDAILSETELKVSTLAYHALEQWAAPGGMSARQGGACYWLCAALLPLPKLRSSALPAAGHGAEQQGAGRAQELQPARREGGHPSADGEGHRGPPELRCQAQDGLCGCLLRAGGPVLLIACAAFPCCC